MAKPPKDPTKPPSKATAKPAARRAPRNAAAKPTARRAATPPKQAETVAVDTPKADATPPPARKPRAAKPAAAKPRAAAAPRPAASRPQAATAAARAAIAKVPGTAKAALDAVPGSAKAWTIGAVVAAAGAGLAAFLTRGRIAKLLSREGHEPVDLLYPDRDGPVKSGDERAPEAYRPDMDAPMTPAEREALRPATLPGPRSE